jgi:hypothetical protein
VTAVGWVAVAAVYLGLHLGVYVFKLRYLPVFGDEGAIFKYHLWSAIALSVAAIGICIVSPAVEAIPLAVAVISAHGIYSISFLELWSLAEGGYSLDILRTLKDAKMTGRGVELAELQAIGARKKGTRVGALLKLGLAHQKADQFELTFVGRGVALILGSVAWAANVRELG